MDRKLNRISLENIENLTRNVSPNMPLPRDQENGNPFIDSDSYRKNMYYLDFLLTQNISVLTGAHTRVYKGLEVVCDDESQTCKYKVLNEQIEAAGDCFFHCALYNLGKKYLGKLGLSKKEQADNKRNAYRFRKMLVDHYKDQLRLNPSNLEMAEADRFLEQYEYVDSVMAKAYADKCDRNVCIFTIGNPEQVMGGGFTVELILNKNALDKKIDFLIHTQGPAHYTTLKRIPGFRTNEIMDRFLEYQVEYQGRPITIWRDLQIQHDATEAPGSFNDKIRTYNINGPSDIYRLFRTVWPYGDLPDFSLGAVEVAPGVDQGVLNDMTPRARAVVDAIMRGESPPRSPGIPHLSTKERPQRSIGSPRERLDPMPRDPPRPRPRPRPPAINRPPVLKPHSIPLARLKNPLPPLAPLKPLNHVYPSHDLSRSSGLSIGAILQDGSPGFPRSPSSRTKRALNKAASGITPRTNSSRSGRSGRFSPRTPMTPRSPRNVSVRTRRALNQAISGITPRSNSSRSTPRATSPSPRTRRALEAIAGITPRSASRQGLRRAINEAPNASPATKEGIAQLYLAQAPNASIHTMKQIKQLDRTSRSRSPRSASPRARTPRAASPRATTARRFRLSSIVNKHIPRFFGFRR